jgi:hypothetical protein
MKYKTALHPMVGISIALLYAVGSVWVDPLSATANPDTPTWSVSDSMTAPVTGIQSVACPSSTDCYAIGENADDEFDTDAGIILTSTDGGATWTTQTDPTGTTTLAQITCPSTTTCYATGADDAIDPPTPTVVVTTDGGANWSVDIVPAGPRSVNIISCPSSTTCFVIGAVNNWAALLLVTTDGGATWTTEALPIGMHRFYGISCASLTSCMAVG